jgi:alpha/beta superfamily hydrolase
MLPSPYKTTFLIISYPLSPRGALTLFRSSTYQSALLALAHTPSAEILIVYGTDDNFTAEDKYDRWADGLKQGAQAKLDIVKIEDGTHFWQGDHKLKLHNAVFTWLDKSSGRS